MPRVTPNRGDVVRRGLVALIFCCAVRSFRLNRGTSNELFGKRFGRRRVAVVGVVVAGVSFWVGVRFGISLVV